MNTQTVSRTSHKNAKMRDAIMRIIVRYATKLIQSCFKDYIITLIKFSLSLYLAL